MNGFPRLVSKQTGRLFSSKWLFSRNTPHFLPFYHVVSNEKLPHIFNYPYRSTEQFEKELDFFLKYFKPVSLKELLITQKGTQKMFHLSFDDGLKECAEIIAPVLIEKGIPATFFVNTAFVDNRQLFHKYKASLILNVLKEKPNQHADKRLAENGLSENSILKAEIGQTDILDEVAELLGIDFQKFLKKNQPYLTTNQILKLQSEGFSIGAHSVDHPEFYKISEKQQIEQVQKSMDWIGEKINPEIKTFSFPFTDLGVSSSVLKKIKEENICDITFGTAGVKHDALDFHFQRYPMEQNGNFIHNLKGEYVYFEMRRLIGKARVKHI